MSNVFELLNAGGQFTGMTFQPGTPPLRDPLRFIGWRRVKKHWEIVTTGLSEFAGKETRDPKRSGFGVEFVLRIGVEDGEEDPPEAWTIDLLMPLARMIFWSSQIPRSGSVLSFDDIEEFEGARYRVYDEANPFGTKARPLEFVKRDGFLAKVHRAMRVDSKAGFGVWNTPVASEFAGLGFVNDQTFGVMKTNTGPVRWLRCLPLKRGESLKSFPANGILKRG